MKSFNSNRVYESENGNYTQTQINEAYDKSENFNQFQRMFDSVSEEMIIEYHRKSLTDAIENEDQQFTFESGVSIPNLHAKVSGKFTMNYISEASNSAEEFVSCMNMLMTRFFDAGITVNDQQRLSDMYLSAKQ